MRLWHKDLIPVLPRQQLLGQWRECCLIAKQISEKGTPNHLLVNKIMNYPIVHFYKYGRRIHTELCKRGYKADWFNFAKYSCFDGMSAEYEYDEPFDTWHNDRYLKQCFYNLQEKYDCGGITKEEWTRITDYYQNTRFMKGK